MLNLIQKTANKISFLICLALTCFFASCNEDDDNNLKVNIGDSLPVFSIDVYYNGNFDKASPISSTTFAGRPSVLVFFDSTCTDCQRQLPVIQTFFKTWGDEARIICIGRGEPTATIRDYWKKQHFTMPVAPQQDNVIFKQFAETGVPRIYMTDAQGIVRYIFADPSTTVTYEQLTMAYLTL